MAFKRYAYFNKGNKFAIVESEMSSAGGKTAVAHCTLGGYSTKDTCEAAGGQWIPSSTGSNSGIIEKYVSPKESVSSGIEIEYSYAPTFNLGLAEPTPQQNQFYLNGWCVIDGYLNFVRGNNDTSATSTGTGLTSFATSPYTDAFGSYMYVNGSSRWNGVHKIQSRILAGRIQTYTKVNESSVKVSGTTNIDIAAESNGKSLLSANDGSHIWLNAKFSQGDYVLITGFSTAHNNGIFKVDSVATDASTESASGIYLGDRLFCYDSDNTLSTEGTEAINTTAEDNKTVTIIKINKDFSYTLAGVEILEDESFELDLSDFQAQAVVYYLKAKLAEDMRDMEAREYFMRLFNKQMEKGSSSKKRGPYIAQGIF